MHNIMMRILHLSTVKNPRLEPQTITINYLPEVIGFPKSFGTILKQDRMSSTSSNVSSIGAITTGDKFDPAS